MKSFSLAVISVVAAAALVAGCGSSTPPPVAGSAAASGAQAPYQYARCMRVHGVSGFPDPQVTTTPGGGSVSARQVVPASQAQSPHFKAASSACAHILPAPGTESGPHGPNKQVLLAFAHCLRAHGVNGFPDPNSQGRLSFATISAAGVDVHSSQFLRAADGCVGVTHGAITTAEVHALVNRAH